MLKSGKLYRVSREFATDDEKCPWLEKNLIIMFINFSIHQDLVNGYVNTFFIHKFLYHETMITVLVNKNRDLLNEGFLIPI